MSDKVTPQSPLQQLILIPGAKLEAFKVDFDNPEVKRQLEKAKEDIKRVLDGQKVDMEKLRNTYITI